MSTSDKPEDKVSAKTMILMVAIIVVAALVFSGRLQNYFNLVPFSPKLVNVEASSGYEGFDYVVYADITVKNTGKAGQVVINCTLYSDTEEYVKTETINIGAQSTLTHRISFPEARTTTQYNIRVDVS